MDIRQLSEGTAALIASIGDSLVAVMGGRRATSGFAWTDELVITTSHGVRRDEGLLVVGPDGEERAATLVGRDPSTDLAVLAVADGGLTPVTWADASALRVGQLVFPVARVSDRVRATMGLVSDVGGPWHTSRGGEMDVWIDVDGSLPGGFSGGALIDAAGQVLGLNNAALTRRGAVVPEGTVQRVAQRLLDHGTLAPGYLGVGFYPGTLPSDLGAVAGQADALMSVSIEPGGPGALAGIQVGDALVRLDGQAVTGLPHLVGLLTAKGAQAEVILTVVRGGQLVEVPVTLGARPSRRGWCG